MKCLLGVTTSNRFVILKDSEDGLPEEDIAIKEGGHKKEKRNKSTNISRPLMNLPLNCKAQNQDEKDEKSSKIKCRKCGYKKNCKKNNICKAEDKCCRFCFKLNHFPKSLNCKKKRKQQQKDNDENRVQCGCQPLREFLVSKGYKLALLKI